MENELSLQGAFLKILCQEQTPVSVYLMNGIKLQGKIKSHDATVLVLENTSSQMVYKHAVSTIVPSRDIVLSPALDRQWVTEEMVAAEEA